MLSITYYQRKTTISFFCTPLRMSHISKTGNNLLQRGSDLVKTELSSTACKNLAWKIPIDNSMEVSQKIQNRVII